MSTFTTPVKQIFNGHKRILITPDVMPSDMHNYYDNWGDIFDVVIVRNHSFVCLDPNKTLYRQIKNNDRVFIVHYRRYLYDSELENRGVFVYTKIDEETLICSFVLGDLTLKEFFTFVFHQRNKPDIISYSNLFWAKNNNSDVTIDLNNINCSYVQRLNKVLLI